MGFSLTSPAPEKCDPTAKNRVWGFFGEQPETSRQNRPQSLQPRRENRPTTTKVASGRTYWPSRDPIGERGGINLYGMVGNDPLSGKDVLGLDRFECDNKGPHIHTGWLFKLTYGIEFQEDGSAKLVPVNGHNDEFDAEKAKAHFKEVMKDKDKRKKLANAVACYWEKAKNKPCIAYQGRKLRQFNSKGGAIMALLAFSLTMADIDDHLEELKRQIERMQEVLENGSKPDELDKLALSKLLSDAGGGGNFATLLFKEQLDNLEPAPAN